MKNVKITKFIGMRGDNRAVHRKRKKQRILVMQKCNIGIN